MPSTQPNIKSFFSLFKKFNGRKLMIKFNYEVIMETPAKVMYISYIHLINIYFFYWLNNKKSGLGYKIWNIKHRGCIVTLFNMLCYTNLMRYNRQIQKISFWVWPLDPFSWTLWNEPTLLLVIFHFRLLVFSRHACSKY